MTNMQKAVLGRRQKTPNSSAMSCETSMSVTANARKLEHNICDPIYKLPLLEG